MLPQLDKLIANLLLNLTDSKEQIIQKANLLLNLLQKLYTGDELISPLIKTLESSNKQKIKICALEVLNQVVPECDTFLQNFQNVKNCVLKISNLLLEFSNQKQIQMPCIGVFLCLRDQNLNGTMNAIISLSTNHIQNILQIAQQLAPDFEENIKKFLSKTPQNNQQLQQQQQQQQQTGGSGSSHKKSANQSQIQSQTQSQSQSFNTSKQLNQNQKKPQNKNQNKQKTQNKKEKEESENSDSEQNQTENKNNYNEEIHDNFIENIDKLKGIIREAQFFINTTQQNNKENIENKNNPKDESDSGIKQYLMAQQQQEQQQQQQQQKQSQQQKQQQFQQQQKQQQTSQTIQKSQEIQSQQQNAQQKENAKKSVAQQYNFKDLNSIENLYKQFPQTQDVFQKEINNILLQITKFFEQDNFTIQENSFKFLKKLFSSNPNNLFKNVLPDTIKKMFNLYHTNQTNQYLLDEIFEVMISKIDRFIMLKALVDQIAEEENPFLQLFIRLLSQAIKSSITEQVRPFLDHIIDIFKISINDQSPDIRKSVVFCLVDLYFLFKSELEQYLQMFHPNQQKLVNIYINRRLEQTNI